MDGYTIAPRGELARHIERRPRKQSTLLVAVDGPGGSGKSTLARALAEHCANSTVLQMDDFFYPTDMRASTTGTGEDIGGDQDWRRVESQVLSPLSRDEPARYQRYDWGTDTLEEWHELPVGGVVLVDTSD